VDGRSSISWTHTLASASSIWARGPASWRRRSRRAAPTSSVSTHPRLWRPRRAPPTRPSPAAGELGIAAIPHPFAPWYCPKPGEYAALLESAGFTVRFAVLFARPSPMPDRDGERDVVAWLKAFAEPWLSEVPEAARAQLFDRIAEMAKPTLWRDGVWLIDYVRLRVEAVKGN
jgi:hypothetical protein